MRYALAALIALVAAPAAAQTQECYESVADPAWKITINEYDWVGGKATRPSN
jgi:hypothetical protein